jgi:hypothetical protein
MLEGGNVDQVRQRIKDRINELNMSLRGVSLDVGKSHTYISQFLDRGSPRVLPEDVRDKLAQILRMPADELRHTPRPNGAGDIEQPYPSRVNGADSSEIEQLRKRYEDALLKIIHDEPNSVAATTARDALNLSS